MKTVELVDAGGFSEITPDGKRPVPEARITTQREIEIVATKKKNKRQAKKKKK